jgi:hypothetical protein
MKIKFATKQRLCKGSTKMKKTIDVAQFIAKIQLLIEQNTKGDK